MVFVRFRFPFNNLSITLAFFPFFLVLFTMLDWGECSLGWQMLIMMICTRNKLVPFALVATGVVLLSLAGCRKEAKKPEIPASSPASYMKDPVFMGQLEEKRKELNAILAERTPLVERMEALIKEHGEDLAALQKIDEWNDLHKKVVELNAKYENVRARQLKVLRERISK